jgi:lipopolysaccharide/colanic/teichoic acid biosynthesis glycosyltransferase
MATDVVSASLLTTPIGAGSLLCALHARLEAITREKLIVASAYADLPPYQRAIRAACGQVGATTTIENLEEALSASAPGDWLLFVDPLCFPVEPITAGPVLARIAHSCSAVHLVSMSQNPGGMTDRVQFDRRGGIRGIHRFYDRRTWMFVSGVSCTLLPASLFGTVRSELEVSQSLADFRRSIASCGVPARDVGIAGATLDLRREAHLLRLSERAIINVPVALQNHPTARIEPGARLTGPVVLHRGAFISADATVIGPAVIGAGTRIESGAVVAQCLIADDVTVPSGSVIAHRAVFGLPDTLAPPLDDFDDAAAALRLDEGPIDRRHRFYPLVKTMFDRSAAALGLAVLSPLLLAVAALIKLDSRGPVFYAELRETIGGRLFRCWKFRTMRVGAEAEQRELAMKNQMDGPQFKIHADPRITTLGRWLRKVSIDELPQLYNVLIGEMSLVGPRPSPFHENQICVPWRQARLSVRAGITGLWQVCREDRRNGDFHQWINYDVMYVRHLSFMVDLRILIATVITGGGAGRVPASWVIHSAIIPLREEQPIGDRTRVEASV